MTDDQIVHQETLQCLHGDVSRTQPFTSISKMSRMHKIVLLLALYISGSLAFAPAMNRWVQRGPPLLRTNIATKGSKPDLFSGELCYFVSMFADLFS